MHSIFGLLSFIPFFLYADISVGKGQFEEFIFARAAAEICLNVELDVDEKTPFADLLSFRKPAGMPVLEMADEIDRLLLTYKLEITQLGCDEGAVVSSLATWQYRVTLFAGIS